MSNFEQLNPGMTRRKTLLALAALATLSACGGGGGGGGGTAAIGIGGTGAFSGVITGFGSIVIDGVRYSVPSITDGFGTPVPAANLRLGMVVAASGASAVNNGRATLSNPVADSSLLGPITPGSINTTARTFMVLGQTVQVSASTFFDPDLTLGFGSLATTGLVVEVYGIVNQSGVLQATYIDDKPANTSTFKIEGVISNLSDTAREFNIGSILLAYGSASIPAGLTLANGLRVRVRLAAATPAPAVWTVTHIRADAAPAPARNWLEVTQAVTAFRSATDFDVGGLRVDAHSAAFPDGRAVVAQGAQVEVEGRVVDGVLLAVKVERFDPQWLEQGDPLAELKGVVSQFVSATNFRVNGIAVTAPNTSLDIFPDGFNFVLNGARVELEGELRGGIFQASLVEEDDGVSLSFDSYGTASDVTTAGPGGSFTLTPLSSSGGAIAVQWDAETRFHDSLSAINLGNQRLEVEGFLSTNAQGGSALLATDISLED